MSQSDDDNIELQGPKKTIAHAVAANGRCYAKEFLNEQVPDRDLAPLAKTFEYLCKLDQFHNDQRFKKLKGEKKLFEFRSNDVRIGAFMVGGIARSLSGPCQAAITSLAVQCVGPSLLHEGAIRLQHMTLTPIPQMGRGVGDTEDLII